MNRLQPFILICWLVTSETSLGETAPDTGSAPRHFEEELVVTGSHVPRKDLTSPGPVIVYGREEIAKSGVASLGEFLQLTPWQGGGVNNKYDGASDGSTQVSLRNLGARRTLVLVDGQRWVNGGVGAGSGFNPGVDLNTIPGAAVERVEILRDGASAVYGSDAIAGVVNIITRRRMNGVEAEAYSGISSHGDALQVQVNGTGGLSTDQGGILMSLGYFHQSSVLTADRSWAARQISYNFATGRVDPSGSTVVPAGAFRVNPANCPTQLCQLLNAAYPGAGSTDWIPDGNPGLGVPVVTDPVTGQQWRRFVPSGPVNDLYNPNSREGMTYLITASDRLSLFANGDYRLTDFARAHLQASWVHSESTSQAAPELLFTSFVGNPIDPTNPYNPFGVPVTATRRLVELGPRDAEPNLNTVRVTAGLDGTVESTYWSLSFAYGRTSTNTYELGTLDTSKAATAIGPAYQDASGVFQCGRPGQTIPGCTPANLFGVGTVTPAMAQALGVYNGRAYGWSQLAAVDAQLSRDLFRLAADRPAGIAAGYQFRRESGGFQPNAIAAAGHSFDFAGQPLQGSFRVHEAYLELVLPIVSDIPLADDIELQAGGRWSQYSSYGTELTYVLGARWRPIRGFTLRGTWSTAFRAPAIDDLYSGQVNTLERATDPCANIPQSNAVLRAQCASGPGGATAVNNGDTNNNLYPSTTGGNPALQPETATTATVGVVVDPPQVKGLSLTADYYHLKLEDLFTTGLGAPLILAGCYPASVGSNVAPDPKDCSLITRDPASGMIQKFLDVEQNAGSLITSGIDVVLRYALATAAGRFRFWVDGNYLLTQNLVLPSGKVVRSAGNYDLKVFNGTLGLPTRLRFNTGMDYDRGPFTAGATARYISGFDECAAPGGNTSGGRGLCSDHNVDPNTGAPYPVHRVASYTAFDVYASYAFVSSLGTTSFSAGVRNVFNVGPPVVYQSFLTFADPSYDFVGRYFWGRIAHKF